MTLGTAASVDPSALRGLTRVLTKTTSAKFSDTDVDALLNRGYHEFINELLQAGGDIEINRETESINLVKDTATVSITGKVLRVYRIDITYDGSNWKRNVSFDIRSISDALDSDTVDANFSQDEPYVDLYVDEETMKGVLYPVPDENVTDGLKIWKTLEISELSATSDEPGIMEAYQPYLAYYAAKIYYLKEEQYNKAEQMELEKQRLLNKAIMAYSSRNEDASYVMTDGHGSGFGD